MSEASSLIPFSIGARIVDPSSGKAYKLLKVLGIGTFAIVYRVMEVTGLDARHYALKCLSKKLLDDQQREVQRNECHLHKLVGKHPHVVEFVNSFENEEWLFLQMEYVPGVDLFTWLSANHDHFQPEDRKAEVEEGGRVQNALHIFPQMLDAVAYVHSKGVFHRDLKPENFMVNPRTLEVKLIDFGLATTDELTTEWECGSRPYMSYECRNEIAGFYSARKADVWSLGIILLNLLAYKCPWSDAHRSCPEFMEYLKEGKHYLVTRFGCPEEVAGFLANKVFTERDDDRCSLTSMRIWADRLADDLPSLLGRAANTTPKPLSLSRGTPRDVGGNSVSPWPESPTECGEEAADEAVFQFGKQRQHQKTASPPVRICNRPSDTETLFPGVGPPPTPFPLKMAHAVAIPAFPRCIPWSEWDDEDEEVDFTRTASDRFFLDLNAAPKNRCRTNDDGSAGEIHHSTLVGSTSSLPDLVRAGEGISKDGGKGGSDNPDVISFLEMFNEKLLARQVNG